ncbi:MAG: CRISPR-associated endonuclease Cas3'' [Clostridiales bacterium]|nr:CRISPR-associated endonuclease Cas3'' [Clostridiales bacterium]
MFIAHSKDNGKTQPLKEHLENVADLARKFAYAFDNGTAEVAYQMGLAHDLGKYSDKFQARIRGDYLGSVDHSTAGGQVLASLGNTVGAYGVMGHHSGLMNGGSKRFDIGKEQSGTFYSRLKKPVENYKAYEKEISLENNVKDLKIKPITGVGFSTAFLIRMLYSTLVDADFLDTEAFMADAPINRGHHDSMDELYLRYKEYVQRFSCPKTSIHQKRNEILSDCLQKAEEERGLYSLTVPTGGGKTISSLGFALKHAKLHGLDRVIYLIPYTSIIEQTAQVIGEILGHENVLEHHSSV